MSDDLDPRFAEAKRRFDEEITKTKAELKALDIELRDVLTAQATGETLPATLARILKRYTNRPS